MRGHDGGRPALTTLVDHDALRPKHDGMIDPHLREVDRHQPVALPRSRYGQPRKLEVDLRHPRLALLDVAAKLLEVRRLNGRDVIVLKFNLVDAVLVRDHLRDVEELERPIRIVIDVRHFQNALKIERHDRYPIELGSIDWLRILRPDGGIACSRRNSGGTDEKFPAFHNGPFCGRIRGLTPV